MKLHDDFPGKEALEAGGFDSVEAVAAASDEELIALDGIGQKTLEKIRAEGTTPKGSSAEETEESAQATAAKLKTTQGKNGTITASLS